MPLRDEKTTISIYVDEKMRDRVQHIAEEEKRTISEQMQKVWKDWLEEYENKS